MDKLVFGAIGALNGLSSFLDGASDNAENAKSAADRYNQIKGRLGSSEIAAKLGLKDSELPFFEASIRDAGRRLDIGDDADETARRNASIAALRFLSWLETIRSNGTDIEMPEAVDAVINEDVGRKQIRALELIIRSLIDERYGSQDSLETELKNLFKPAVVDKWKQSGDQGDLLSGTTFSELASLFVNKQEYPNYEKLYGETAFLNYLRDRRKTIQNFLDDIRRVRNTLAHNKAVTNTQLSLLALYYEELIAPIQDAYDEGETKVDPSTYIDVSQEELDGYFTDLREDIEGVKDDIADFRASVEGALGLISEDTKEIKQTTEQVKNRTGLIAAGVAVLLVGVGAIYFITSGTKEDTAQIKQDTTTIKETTERTDQNVSDIKAATEQTSQATQEIAKTVQESSERIAGSLDQIQAGFQNLAQSGGVIPNPERPEQFYHNARMYEQRGDYGNARRSYNEYFKFKLDFLDPHLRYQTFLKVQEGRQGALEIYRALATSFSSVSAEMALSLLESAGDRKSKLQDFIETHPNYSPAYYYLANQYAKQLVGEQTLDDKRQERDLLSKLLAHQEDGNFVKYFVDKSYAASLIEDAKSRIAASENLNLARAENPISLSGTPSNAGWMLNLSIAELAKEIFYSFDEKGPFKSTGLMEYIDPRTGEKMPNPMIQLPMDAGKQDIYVSYKDLRGDEKGPYVVNFDPQTALVESKISQLKMTRNSWLSSQDRNGQHIVYFTHLNSSRCGIRDVRYSVDSEDLDQQLELPSCDPLNPYAVEGATYFYLPSTPRFIAVQLTYADGSLSELVRLKPGMR